MTDRLHLSPKHRAEIEALLRKHLPDVEVWAYGSRVTGRSHDGSDLDLVLRGPGCRGSPPSPWQIWLTRSAIPPSRSW